MSKSNTKRVDAMLLQKLEAVLFLENSYVAKGLLCDKISCTLEQLEEGIATLKKKYQQSGHALTLAENRGKVILTVNAPLVKEIIAQYFQRQNETLSQTLLETLAIIAYSQPITKSEINAIRGVNSNNTVSILLSKNLICTAGKKPIPGNPHQYITTPQFLQVFGLSSIQELPTLEKRDKELFDANSSPE